MITIQAVNIRSENWCVLGPTSSSLEVVRIRAEPISGILLTCKLPPMPPGRYHAAVTTNLVDRYDFGGDYVSVLRPTVTKALPPNGGVAGGTLVTVLGVFMSDGLAVACAFGDKRVSGSLVSSESMACISPAHAAGDILLSVCLDNTTCSESSVKFSFKDVTDVVATETSASAQGFVISVHPSIADSAGGEVVSIMTSELDLRTGVYCHFGETAVAAIRVSTRMSTCISPEHDPGINTLSVRSGTGTLPPTTLFTHRFLFAAAPIVYSIEPSTGPSSGGSIVTARGKFFELAESRSCLFDSIQVEAISVSNTTVACIAPAVISERVVQFNIRDPFGRSSTQALQFQYGPSSTVHGISPSIGWSDTSQIISVQGRNFVPTTGMACAAFAIVAKLGETEASTGSIKFLALLQVPRAKWLRCLRAPSM